MLNLNEKLFFLINSIAGQYQILDGFFIFVTKIFVPASIIFLIVWFFIILPRRNKTLVGKFSNYKDGLLFIFSLGTVYLVTQLIKISIAFPRPTQILEGVNSLSKYGNYDSFPSMHSALAFAVASFVYHYSKSTGVILFAMAVLVGFSRIFVGVHFPVDVVVGAFIGVLISWCIIAVFKPYKH